jgi:hypothetical protein
MDFQKILKYKSFVKIHPEGAKFHVDGQTDERHDEALDNFFFCIIADTCLRVIGQFSFFLDSFISEIVSKSVSKFFCGILCCWVSLEAMQWE